MAWKPIQQKSGLSPLMRETISRGTMIVICVVLAFASYKTIRFCNRARQQAIEEAEQRSANTGRRPTKIISGTGLPYLVGVGMGIGSALLGLAAITPTRFWERFNSPPGDPHEEAAGVSRIIRRGSRF